MPEAANMILSYELSDDPGVEHEVEVGSVDEARRHLLSRADMLSWCDLTDSSGEVMDVSLP